MRKYTDKEKFYIRQLVEKSKQYECFLAINLFDPILNGNGNRISVDLQNNHLIYYEINTKQAAWIDSNSCYQTLDVSCFLEIESMIVELALLIKDLLDNRLIYFLDEGNTGGQDDIIFKSSGYINHVTKSLDKRLVDILSDCAHKPVLCLPELVMLKENDFVLEEDKRHSELIEQYRREIEVNNRNHKEAIEQKQHEMEQARQLNEQNIAAAEKRNKENLDAQKDIADKNLKAAKDSNKTAIRIAIFSALATGLLSALIAQFIPMTIKHKQVRDEIVLKVNEPIQRLDSLVELYGNIGAEEKIDSIQFVLKNELESISSKLDKIITENSRRTKK